MNKPKYTVGDVVAFKTPEHINNGQLKGTIERILHDCNGEERFHLVGTGVTAHGKPATVPVYEDEILYKL